MLHLTMNPIVPCRMPAWQSTALKEIAKSKSLSKSDIIRLSFNFFMLNYKGRFDRQTLANVEFAARKKIEAIK